MRKESLAELIRKRSNIFALIMCLMGVVINMALNSLVSALDLPLYLDTVGTVLVAPDISGPILNLKGLIADQLSVHIPMRTNKSVLLK